MTVSVTALHCLLFYFAVSCVYLFCDLHRHCTVQFHQIHFISTFNIPHFVNHIKIAQIQLMHKQRVTFIDELKHFNPEFNSFNSHPSTHSFIAILTRYSSHLYFQSVLDIRTVPGSDCIAFIAYAHFDWHISG